MNRNNAALITVGFAGLILGAVVAYFVLRTGKPATDPGPAKYVLMFGEPNGSTLVTANLSEFQGALASPAPNWSTLQEVPSEGATPTPVPIPSTSMAPAGTVLISRIQVIQQRQSNSPCTMHVTQKVGLNNPTQVRQVLAALSPETTPSQ